MTSCCVCGRRANNVVDGQGVCYRHDTSGQSSEPYHPQPGDLERALGETPRVSGNLLDPKQTALGDKVAQQIAAILREESNR